MSKFHRLSVSNIERETRDAVAITLAVPAALAESFRFAAGQHLTLRADIGGHDVRRSYSICSGCDDDELRVAVKKVPGGRFSIWVNETLKPGDIIDVMTPEGRFFTSLAPEREKNYVAFTAGSGITPVLSLIRTTLAREPRSRLLSLR